MNVKIMLCLYGSEWLFSGSDWWETGAIKSFRDAAARKSSRILDVGCGDGRLIASLADIGFRSVQGVDPFIDSEISYPNGAKVYKRELSEMKGSFDLITMHHCLEHVLDQHGTMRDLLRLLSPDGRCVISIPTIDSWASNEYGVNWVDLDPPRHFYIHTRDSVRHLLNEGGFEIIDIIDNSTAFQILGSETIKRGKPLVGSDAAEFDYRDLFTKSFRAQASARAIELNRIKQGDSIAVHARRRRNSEAK